MSASLPLLLWYLPGCAPVDCPAAGSAAAVNVCADPQGLIARFSQADDETVCLVENGPCDVALAADSAELELFSPDQTWRLTAVDVSDPAVASFAEPLELPIDVDRDTDHYVMNLAVGAATIVLDGPEDLEIHISVDAP